ncbi:hypothetical protein FF1_034397 [Malus domestica]
MTCLLLLLGVFIFLDSKVSIEARFSSQSPTNWWTEELSTLDIEFFGRVITLIKLRDVKSLTIVNAVRGMAPRSLPRPPWNRCEAEEGSGDT